MEDAPLKLIPKGSIIIMRMEKKLPDGSVILVNRKARLTKDMKAEQGAEMEYELLDES